MVQPSSATLAATRLLGLDASDAEHELRTLLGESSLAELLRGSAGLPTLSEEEAAALLQLELSCRGRASDLTQLDGCPRTHAYVRWPRARGCCVVNRGHALLCERLRPEPRMALVHDFLSPEECVHIIGRAREWLHPSRVVNHSAEGATGQRSAARTSWSCKVTTKDDVVVRRAVQRAAYLAGLGPQHSEAVQVVHYQPGQEYRPHFDWFSQEDARIGEKLAVRGNRLVSFFVYLALPEAGGRTAFPRLAEAFQPSAGGALVWYNLDRHGVGDERTLHAGEPVTRGEKWGMNIWLRERAAPRKPLVSVCLQARVGAVRVALALPAAAAASTPKCGGCGDDATPLGLCLCKAAYSPDEDALPVAEHPSVKSSKPPRLGTGCADDRRILAPVEA